MKRRVSIGHDLSHIWPKGTPVLNSAITSTVVVPFMEKHSNSTREVTQDGRRGALILSVSIKHPDSGKFIDTAGKLKVTNTIVSIRYRQLLFCIYIFYGTPPVFFLLFDEFRFYYL